jgi:hypothetical protein
VTSNILLGPFGHKYDTYLDYWSWGNFVDNWHGTTFKEYVTLWPYASSASTNGGNYLGMPIFPVDYGKNASFWILDGNPNRYFRVMQGVNIVEGSIYSNRPTIIGGGLLRSDTSGYIKEKVNENMAGYSLAASDTHSLYVDATVRYDQVFYNTDIILMPPTTGTAESSISPPYTYHDKTVTYHVFDQQFSPYMHIAGGTIYVGERQSLTIKGSSLENMWINPEKIVVAKGGTLTISRSSYLNVITDIYVEGGTLIIQPDARIKGNIYVYDEGTVDIRGTFWMNTTGANDDEKLLQGLFVYGEDTVGTNGIIAAGRLKVTTPVPFIHGDNGGGWVGSVHLVGGDWADLVNAPSTLPAPNDVSYFLCDGYDPATGRCMHFGKGSGPGDFDGSWLIGSFGAG